jgi:PAS domain S-box-containing protein
MAADITFTAFIDATPSPYLVLDADLVIRYVNPAYVQATGRTRDELIGKYFFDALPESPGTPGDAQRTVMASLRRVLETGKPDTLVPQRYDIPAPDQPGGFEERWWSEIHTPIPGPDGKVKWIVQRAEDVTTFVHSPRARRLTEESSERQKGMAAELYARTRDLHRLYQELRQAHARERQVAVALQEAMLSVPDLDRHTNIAVRYLPATTSLNV